MPSTQYLGSYQEVKAAKHRIPPVVPYFRDGILLMGLITVFPLIYAILSIVIQMAQSDIWDQISSVSSLARCALLISILWSTIKDGMIEYSKSFGFALGLIIVSEFSLLLTCVHSIVGIVNAFHSHQVVHRPVIFLLTISALELIFNILLFQIIRRVLDRSKIRMAPECSIVPQSARPVDDNESEEILQPFLGESEEMVKISTRLNKKIDRVDRHFASLRPAYTLQTAKGRTQDRLRSHSHRHFPTVSPLPLFKIDVDDWELIRKKEDERNQPEDSLLPTTNLNKTMNER